MSTKLVYFYERKIAILVEDLRLWILSQPHLNSRISDEFLRGFLRCCQFDLSVTKIRIDSFYTLKNDIPSVLKKRNLSKQLLDLCQMGIAVCLPLSINDKNVRIHFSKYPSSHQSNSSTTFKYSDIIKLFFMLAEVNMIESRNSDHQTAIVYVFDFEGATFKQSLKIDLSFSKRIFNLIQYGLPLQIGEVHFINASKYFIYIIRIACSFLSVDLKKKMHVHNSIDSFYKHIPQEFLPLEYGGKNGSLQTCIKRQMENLVKFGKYFEEDDVFGVNEALRRKKN